MTTTPQQLDEAREAVSSRARFSLPWLQRTLCLSYQGAVSMAEALEAEGRIGPQWRQNEKGTALRQYGAAARAVAAMEAGQHVAGFSGPGDAREVAYAWHQAAARLGATPEELATAGQAPLNEPPHVGRPEPTTRTAQTRQDGAGPPSAVPAAGVERGTMTTTDTTPALAAIREAAGRTHGTLYAPSVLEEAADLLADLWAASECHGVSREEWRWETDLAGGALGVVSRRHSAVPDPERTVDQVGQLQRDLIAALAEQGITAVPGQQVRLERLETTPRWGIGGTAQLSVGIWTNGGWDLALDGVQSSPVIRITAPATTAGAKEVAELVAAIARGQAPDPFRRGR